MTVGVSPFCMGLTVSDRLMYGCTEMKTNPKINSEVPCLAKWLQIGADTNVSVDVESFEGFICAFLF